MSGDTTAPPPEAGDLQPLIKPASRFWRLPVIRHIRWLWYCWQVAGFNPGIGIDTGFDAKVLRQMKRGIV